jgi:hypothetical protein
VTTARIAAVNDGPEIFFVGWGPNPNNHPVEHRVRQMGFSLHRSGPQKKIPSLRCLLHEPVFMMQAAEHGSLHNPVPDRQTVSVLVAGKMLRHGLGRTRA